MSLARTTMIHRCSTLRGTSTTSSWNTPGKATWDTHLPDVACRAWYNAGRRAISGQSDVVVTDLRMIVPPGTDVLSSDRIASVTDRQGRQLFAGPFVIDAIAQRTGHVELMLRKVG